MLHMGGCTSQVLPSCAHIAQLPSFGGAPPPHCQPGAPEGLGAQDPDMPGMLMGTWLFPKCILGLGSQTANHHLFL